MLPQNRDPAGNYPYFEPSQNNWWRSATVEHETYLLPDSRATPRVAGDYPCCPKRQRDEVTTLCDTLQERHSFEILILNQTRPDVGIPVVKVIVPGMRHFWARLAPGRLYDVPVTMGWLPRAKLEEELNPTAMFL